jgi:hypothetical protein
VERVVRRPAGGVHARTRSRLKEKSGGEYHRLYAPGPDPGICGHVGCCDSSKNKHATKHFHATTHPIIQSFEPGEDWLWCYVDQVMMEPS